MVHKPSIYDHAPIGREPVTNKLTGLILSGKRADSESDKRGQPSLYQVLVLRGSDSTPCLVVAGKAAA